MGKTEGAATDQAERSPNRSKRERSKARRKQRQERERQAAKRAALRRRLGFVAGGIVLIALLLGLAQLLSGGGGPEVVDNSQPAEVAADATALPPHGAGGRDAAIGLAAPGVTGTDFSGDEVTIGGGGQPQALLFLAHWCPACQRELPVVVDFIEQGRMPNGVEVVAISTGHDQRRPNWPPAAWLERENWQGPVLVDAENRVANAYGLTATPYWVFVDGQGGVVQRASGQVDMDQLENLLRTMAQNA